MKGKACNASYDHDHVAGYLKLKTSIVWSLFCQGIIYLTFTKNKSSIFYVILSLRAASMLILFQIISHLKKTKQNLFTN